MLFSVEMITRKGSRKERGLSHDYSQPTIALLAGTTPSAKNDSGGLAT